jgi:NAD(P)-dependent dehydrogenase (short-subunit alcohol dehydrogenase family)
VNLERYCATKGGVRLFAKAVAMECAAAGDNIQVNTVYPGSLTRRFGRRYQPLPAAMRRLIPTGVQSRDTARDGWASADIANRVLFLASDAGAELVIDGGMTGGARPRWS